MDELFAVDAEARRKTLTTEALLDDIRHKIETAQSVASPSSAFSNACQSLARTVEEAHPLLGVSRIRAEY